MKASSLAAFAAVQLLASAAVARDIGAMHIPDTATVGGRTLHLNGAGIRRKTMFKVKVYLASLYLETPAKDPARVVSSDQIKRVDLVMMRDLGKDKIVEAVREGFAKNSASAMPALQARLERFLSVVPNLRESDHLVITYVPGQGTTLSLTDGRERTSVPGKDFADALFSVWLGRDPVDGELKEALLGL